MFYEAAARSTSSLGSSLFIARARRFDDLCPRFFLELVLRCPPDKLERRLELVLPPDELERRLLELVL